MTKLPAKVKQLLLKLKEKAITAVQAAWSAEPAMVISGTVSAIVAVATAFGVVLHPQTVELVVGLILPIILGALIRSRVTPAAKAMRSPHRR
jgi:hypothetical protein